MDWLGEIQYYNGIIIESKHYNGRDMQGAWNNSFIFYKWTGQFLERGKKVLEEKNPDKSLMKENGKLKLIIGEMTIANEILKNYIRRKR